MYLVSSCLCGNPCRYDGSSGNLDEHPRVKALLSQRRAVPVCPELLGGLPVPRPVAEIAHGTGAGVLQEESRIVDLNGKDVTDNYRAGAQKALLIGMQAGCTKAILKTKSPACGVGLIYDGEFTKTLIEGDGVLAALLKAHGFSVLTDKMVPKVGFEPTQA